MFVPGDIVVAASDVPRQAELRNLRGPGRLLHFDSEFVQKGTLSTGTLGLVIGVAIDPTSGMIYAADAQARTVVRFDRNGTLQPLDAPIPAAKYGTIAFTGTGKALFGVHNNLGSAPEDPSDFTLIVWDRRENEVSRLATEVDGGKLGFHCISHLSVEPAGQIVRYVSENGRRIMQFDLVAEAQREDFALLDDDDTRGTYGLDHTPTGDLIMATGDGVTVFDPDGNEITRFEVSTKRGWSRVRVARDGRTFFLNNFLDGTIEHRALDDGSVIQSHNIGQPHCLCGIDQYPEPA